MIVDRVKNILLTPKQEWPVIEPEPTTAAQLYTGYVIPLAALSAVFTLIHMSVIGVSVPYLGNIRTPFVSGLTYAVVHFIFSLLGLYLVALIINGLAPTFAAVRDQRQALKTAAYAFTPAWLAAVFGLLPVLSTLLSLLAGLYGIYLLYLGLPLLMKSPPEKAVGYTATVVVCTILVGIVLAIILSSVGGIGRFGPYGSLHGFAPQSEEARDARAAAVAGAIVGNVLGTDDKGKQGLAKAMAQMAAAGREIEQQEKAGKAGGAAVASAAPAAASTDTSTADAAAATARLASAVGGALGGEHRVEPVDFRALKAMLPESAAGMQRTNSAGSNEQALGVKTSNATGDYQGSDGARLHIKIADVSGVSGLLGLAGAFGQKTDSESDSGFEKDKTLGGRQFHEKFQKGGKHGEVSTIVAQRFEVDVTGDGADIDTLEQAATSIDFSRLESMKNQGAQPQ
jgi:hypothetical protein